MRNRNQINLIVLAILLASTITWAQKTPILKVGHVGHDHQSALYVAALAGEEFKAIYGIWFKEIRNKDLYELYDGEKKIAEVELYKAGGGSEMPTMMSQRHFDVGLGGVAPVAFFIDKGAPIKIIAPLHSKGDMLVVKPDLKINSWQEFIDWVNAQEIQVRIGYKNPEAVALLIFQRALKEAGITYTGDKANTEAKVLLINMKGEANLNPGLQTDQIEGYVSNNPWCAIAEEKGLGHCVAELHDLPPGVFKEHPCCCIAAHDQAIKKQGAVIQKFLELMAVATHYINSKPDKAAEYVAKWIGTSPELEKKSMATSGYSIEPDALFMDGMWVWYNEMVTLGKIIDKLKDKSKEEFEKMVYNFSLLKPALASVQKRIK
jgi:NitT/TauT family transport system substrate-binding protein